MSQQSALRALLIAASLAACLFLYLHISSQQFAVNNKLKRTDQGAYLEFAKRAYESGFTYTGGRARMPLFPWLQALFYSPEMSDEAFFAQGKQVNIAISLVALATLGCLFFSQLPRLYAVYALAVISYLFFALKAPYFQAEILYYALFAFAFILSINAIQKPRWYKTVGLGLLLGLAQYSKASAILCLALYSCSYLVPFALEFGNQRLNARELLRMAAHALAPVFIFTLLLSPYFIESKQRYGQYLYNVSTTLYIWYDSWDEVKAGARAAGDREGWPNLPDEEIPSLAKYLAERSAGDILNRFSTSLHRFLQSINWYGLPFHICVGILLLVGCLASGLPGGQNRISRADLHLCLYLMAFFAAYSLSTIWYWPIVQAPRVTLMILIPFFWVLGLALKSLPIASLEKPAIGNALTRWHVIYALVYLVTFFQIYEMAAFRSAENYAGG
ncbi:MAG: glycosyltransferase family 39 protein [Chloroflexi bacterium]|nr:glycosyltransferase family 39 protein [Chloroflexota bacterium]